MLRQSAVFSAAETDGASLFDTLGAAQLRVLQEASYAGCVRARTSAWGKPNDEGVAKLAVIRGLVALGLLEFVEKTGDEWSVIRDAVYCYVLSPAGEALIAEHKGRLMPPSAKTT